MKIIKDIAQLKTAISQARTSGEVGFVPTMGALHTGHISLVERAAQDCEVVVVSIFVNPTQFNDKSDLERYPRTEKQDIALLEQSGCSIVFMPSVEQMYPEPDTRQFDFGALGNVMEGANRPGHFNGVAQIVSKLFDAVEPDKSYFGEKDYQQLAIIRQMTKLLGYKTQIIGCPICRDTDGLALSSRNMLLSPEQREAAPHIYRCIKEASQKEWTDAQEATEWVREQIDQNPHLEVEYFELADGEHLQPIEDWKECKNPVGFAVVRAGKIRLIDNIKFK